jgi:hypothetical protein
VLDADGGYLDGKDDRLHFPRFVPNIPVKTFVVVPYDTKTRSVLRTDHNATFVGLNLKEYRCPSGSLLERQGNQPCLILPVKAIRARVRDLS